MVTGGRSTLAPRFLLGFLWNGKIAPEVTCYWARPEDYEHVAMRQMRRLDLVWEGKEVGDFDEMSDAAKDRDEPIPDFVKGALRLVLGQNE